MVEVWTKKRVEACVCVCVCVYVFIIRCTTFIDRNLSEYLLNVQNNLSI